MRKALIVGINYYENNSSLEGCVNDAYSIKSLLDRHGNGTINFDTSLVTSVDNNSAITRIKLKSQVKELFKGDSEVALFYFAGHGYIEDGKGYLMTSECKEGDEGLPMNELMDYVNSSPAKNKIIILDCCHSGALGDLNILDTTSVLSKGTTILTASKSDQYSVEKEGAGVFTNLLVDALSGGASSLTGKITPGGLYSHIDQSLGAWEQRPVFKTNIEYFTILREVTPPISLENLLKITDLFEERGSGFKLNPTYEPESGVGEKPNMEKFAILQKYNRVNLVVPVDAPHMYHAAMESKSCVLTLLGQHYWSLVQKKRL